MNRENPISRAVDLFRRTFNESPEWIAWAPGRINLIGDHTDYNFGFVLPCAIDLGIAIAASRAESNSSRAISAQSGPAEWSITGDPPPGWAIYPYAVARAAGARSELLAAVESSLPTAGGVSSSAALEVAFATLWNAIDELDHDPLAIAKLTQRAENETVGVQCGIMDMLASASGVDGSALLIDTRSLEVSAVAIPDDLAIALLNTGKPRALAESAYNQRRAECERAARELGADSLREVSLDQIDTITDPTARKRARHVVTENQRVQDFALALEDSDLDRLGQLMAQSHASLRDDYEVSCEELDVMVECAESAGAIGARLTGAGFGGSVVALVRRSDSNEFLAEVEQCYKLRVKKHEPRLLICNPSEGAHMIDRIGDWSQF